MMLATTFVPQDFLALAKHDICLEMQKYGVLYLEHGRPPLALVSFPLLSASLLSVTLSFASLSIVFVPPQHSTKREARITPAKIVISYVVVGGIWCILDTN